MAYLIDEDANSRCYLTAYHKFGRLQHVVDTQINCSKISKLHAVIEWRQGAWYLWDVSTNGTWLNNKKLEAKTRYILNLNDKIDFPGTNFSYRVEELDEPRDLLIPVLPKDALQKTQRTEPLLETAAIEPNTIEPMTLEPIPLEPISLDKYHLLPTDQSPEYAVFYDESDASWYYESILEPGRKILTEDKFIEFANIHWHIHLVRNLELTKTLRDERLDDAEDYTLTFNTSQDEEKTQLWFESGNRKIDLNIHIHHYLTLMLARNRADDIRNNLADKLQGWVGMDKLSQDLGISPNHINIQIHRARKQLVDNGVTSDDIIQRKSPGFIRLNCNLFTIYKGKALEFTTESDLVKVPEGVNE